MNADPIVVTGVGICSALGLEAATTVARLRAGATGIARHDDRVPGFEVWAGLLAAEDSEQLAREAQRGPRPELFDRTGQLASLAARRAVTDAALALPSAAPERVALVLGTSHGGRSQLDAFVLGGKSGPAESQLLLQRAAHQAQTAAVAATLGVHGPVLTISSACGSSGVAIAHGFELLRSGKADVALVGGADGFSRLTYAGFAALGAVADGPCGPFSSRIGMTLGEGAGILVLERLEHALARGARLHATLLGYGSSWDAYHLTEPEPSGAGMGRALCRALRRSGVVGRELSWFHAHGTGTRANDAAECLAIGRQLPEAESTAVVVSTKSFTGHTLGASSAIGFILASLAMGEQLLPPTVNFEGPRPGCDFDFVPNQSRTAETQVFAVTSAAFGGANVALVAEHPGRLRRVPALADDPIVICGLGVVSALGTGLDEFARGLAEGQSGFAPLDTAWLTGDEGGPLLAARLGAFDVRKLLPALDARRADRVMQYGLVACHEALRRAGWLEPVTGSASERVGLVVGTSRGAVSSFAKYLDSVAGGNWARASAMHFPNLVMSSMGGFISKALGLRGIASTVVGSGNAGLSALAHAVDLFRWDDSQDAVVVVAADQLEPLFFDAQRKQGHLAAPGQCLPGLYDAESPGVLLGEGAGAVVIERRSHALARGAKVYATIAGIGMTHDAHADLCAEPEGEWLARAVELALHEASVEPAATQAIYGHGSGHRELDQRELRAMQRIFGEHAPPFSCVTGNAGYLEAGNGLLGLAAASLGFERQVVFPLLAATRPRLAGLDCVLDAPRARACSNVLVTASGHDGANTALVLKAGAC